ncbi:MAG: hypothetical protein GTO53_02865 [Planctomycetales bacterium]|nr:hypothetical protein [Planctomycetales bacterium]NIM08111.1 hypothetical protein [Planctomycetales bacterium]NIN07606.1 hypothetical protein [Planctomycetales bacterium]NIN76728.1 hypothetical protein [Planctomycetales bacterium]NIO33917.1 hypothetical protein [Planctomycetales bacterium]
MDQPKPHRIRKGSTLYVFEPKTVADGGTYLGEFKVTEVVDPGAEANAEAGEGGAAAGGLAGAAGGVNTVSLEASWKMTDEEVDRLERSVNRRGPWTLYEKMPADSHTLFDDITAEELGPNDPQPRELEKVDRLKKLLPADVVQEYVKDHEQPEEDDPPDRIEMYVRFKKNYEKPVPNQEPLKYERRQEMWLPKVSAVDETGEPLIPGADELESLEIVEIKDRRYSRQLRDYSLLFRKIYRERDQLLARKAALASDIQNMQTVLTDKNKRIEDFQGENERLQNDKKGFARDLDLLSSLLAKIEQENTDAARRSENLRKQNIQLGERLDQAQMKAVRRMNDRAPAPQARRQEAPPTKNPPQLATSG